MDIKSCITCWAIAFKVSRNFRRNDNQKQWLHSQNTWNKVEHRFRSFQLYSMLGQRISEHKEEIIIGSRKVVWPLGWLSPTTVQLKSFYPILWTDKLTWDETLSLSILEQYGRFRRQLKELEKIKVERRDLLHLFIIFRVSCVLWRLNHSQCRKFLRARANRRPSAHKNANSQNTRCPNQIFMCSSFRTLCSFSWSRIVSSIEGSRQWEPFSQSQSLCLDEFTGDFCLDWRYS